jgi:hypothetical protein
VIDIVQSLAIFALFGLILYTNRSIILLAQAIQLQNKTILRILGAKIPEEVE